MSLRWLRCADVIRFHMGPTFGVIAQILVALSLAGIGIAQARQSSLPWGMLGCCDAKRKSQLVW